MARSKRKLLKKRSTRKYKKFQKGGDKHKLIVKLQGGIGNRFFQIMAGLGFAEKWGMDVYISNNYTKWNHIPEEESIKQLLALFSNVKLLDNSYNNSNIKQLNENEKPNSDVYIEDYFQDIKYMPKNQPKLNILEPHENIISNINNNNLYFIHFRLGDYLSNSRLSFDLINYYKYCINKIKSNNQNAIFLIVSNDINSTKKLVDTKLKNILKSNQYIYDTNISRIDTLYYISKCKGGICVHSTFSWMGAYCIENKDKNLIFMPKPWVKSDNSKEYANIYPEWATVIDINTLPEDFKKYRGGKIELNSLDFSKKSKSNTITWILQNYLPFVNAGSEHVAHNINKFLIKNGYTVNVVGDWEDQEFEGVKLLNIKNIDNIKKVFEETLVFCSQIQKTELTLKIANKLDTNAIIFLHSIDWINIEYWKTLINPSKLFIVYNSKWLNEKYNSNVKSMILYPPVKCEEYYTKTTNKYVTLINIGITKGGYQLIEIAKKMPDIQFLGIEGSYDTQIIDKSIPNITYKPTTKDIKSVYAETDILIMPSVMETWGRVATEAMCSGIPIIATPIEGLKENLGPNGIFIERESIDEWVSTIRKLKEDRTYYNEISNKYKIRSSEINSKEQLNKLLKYINNIEK